jgi:anti-sigma regulatory factor (Ser/Thr protein kinase)
MSVSTVNAKPVVMHSLNDGWPTWRILPKLKAKDTSPKLARDAVRYALEAWDLLDEFLDSAALIASELVTNVYRASIDGQAPDFQMALFTDKSRLLIVMWDNAEGAPEKHEADDDAEFGRGLTICDLLGELNWFPVHDGKVIRVWVDAEKAVPQENHPPLTTGDT